MLVNGATAKAAWKSTRISGGSEAKERWGKSFNNVILRGARGAMKHENDNRLRCAPKIKKGIQK